MEVQGEHSFSLPPSPSPPHHPLHASADTSKRQGHGHPRGHLSWQPQRQWEMVGSSQGQDGSAPMAQWSRHPTPQSSMLVPTSATAIATETTETTATVTTAATTTRAASTPLSLPSALHEEASVSAPPLSVLGAPASTNCLEGGVTTPLSRRCKPSWPLHLDPSNTQNTPHLPAQQQQHRDAAMSKNHAPHVSPLGHVSCSAGPVENRGLPPVTPIIAPPSASPRVLLPGPPFSFHLAPAPQTPPKGYQHPASTCSATLAHPCQLSQDPCQLSQDPALGPPASSDVALGPTALQIEAASRIKVQEVTRPGEDLVDAPGSGSCDFRTHRKKQGLDRKDLPEDGYSWHKYGHKTLMGLFSRAYYRCTQRASGCRAKKSVDTALKESNEVRITYDGAHNHPPERQATGCVSLEAQTNPELPGWQPDQAKANKWKTQLGNTAQAFGVSFQRQPMQQQEIKHEQQDEMALRREEELGYSHACHNIEIKSKKQRRLVLFGEAQLQPATTPQLAGGVSQRYMVIEEDSAPWAASNLGCTGHGGNTPVAWGEVDANSPRSDGSAVLEQPSSSNALNSLVLEENWEVASYANHNMLCGSLTPVQQNSFRMSGHSPWPSADGDRLDLELRL